MFNKLVLCGGSIKCIMYIGMLEYFEENDIILGSLNEIVGTSAGAFFGLLIVLEYSVSELKKICLSMNFEDLKDVSLSNLDSGYGLDDGERLNNMIKKIIRDKGLTQDISMKELYIKTKINFVSSSYNVNTKKVVFFDNNSDIPVYLAVRMSMNIPFIFCAVNYKNHLYVDGGIICNIPIKYLTEKYKEPEKVIKNTLCTAFIEENFHNNQEINKFDTYLYNILKSSFHCIETSDKNFIKSINGNLLILKTNMTTTSSFDLSYNEKVKLIENGFLYTKQYIENLIRI